MEIRIKRLTETAQLPKRGSEYAAGYDLYADLTEAVVIPPHQSVMIGTGLAAEIPEGYFGGVFARSGLASSPWRCPTTVKWNAPSNLRRGLHSW